MRHYRLLPLLVFAAAALAACGRVADTTTTVAASPSTTEAEAAASPGQTTASGAVSSTSSRAATTTAPSPPGLDEVTTTRVIPLERAQVAGEDPVESAADRLEETTLLAAAEVPTSTSAAIDPNDDEASIADIEVDMTADETGAGDADDTAASQDSASPSIVPTTTSSSTTTAPSTTTTTTAPSVTTTSGAPPTTVTPPTTVVAATTSPSTTSSTSTTAARPATAVNPAPTAGPAEVAMALVDSIDVFPTADGTSAQWSFDRATQFGNPTVFLIAGRQDTRLKVLLPVRQKHTYGWINAADVQVSTTDLRAVVSLSNRDVTLYRGQERLSASSAVIGKSSTPTPIGSFFVTDKLRHANPAGGYGPWIVALSARSEALTTFNGGEPLIALHGTNKPWLVGGRHSNGCIRLPNDAITELAQLVPLGTPVDIVA